MRLSRRNLCRSSTAFSLKFYFNKKKGSARLEPIFSGIEILCGWLLNGTYSSIVTILTKSFRSTSPNQCKLLYHLNTSENTKINMQHKKLSIKDK